VGLGRRVPPGDAVSSTTCEHCNGWGTVCTKCGKARRRKSRHWYQSKGCPCYGGRLRKCPDHQPSTWSCDVCGVKKTGTTHADAHVGELDVCNSCNEIAESAQLVAVEQVLERRTGVANVAEAGEASIIEALKAEVLWWRGWALKAYVKSWFSSGFDAERIEHDHEALVKWQPIRLCVVCIGKARGISSALAVALDRRQEQGR